MLLLTGYSWVAFSMFRASSITPDGVEICIFKIVTNLPCPACGSTRAVVSIFRGEFLPALLLNPLGYIIVIAMVTLPFWLLFDTIWRKDSLLKFYIKFESVFRRKAVVIFAIVLLLANWIWNIVKEFS